MLEILKKYYTLFIWNSNFPGHPIVLFAINKSGCVLSSRLRRRLGCGKFGGWLFSGWMHMGGVKPAELGREKVPLRGSHNKRPQPARRGLWSWDDPWELPYTEGSRLVLHSPKWTSGPVTGYGLISGGGVTSGNAGLFYKRNLHLRGSAASWECPALPVYV